MEEVDLINGYSVQRDGHIASDQKVKARAERSISSPVDVYKVRAAICFGHIAASSPLQLFRIDNAGNIHQATLRSTRSTNSDAPATKDIVRMNRLGRSV